MALPSYSTPVQRTYYYAYLFYCGVVFFFLVAPLIAIVPISFSHSPFICAREETYAENTRKTDKAGISGVSL